MEISNVSPKVCPACIADSGNVCFFRLFPKVPHLKHGILAFVAPLFPPLSSLCCGCSSKHDSTVTLEAVNP